MTTATKLKTYHITLATHFMSGHPREGEPTEFVEKIKDETKIHTIRGNFNYWKKRVQSIRNGEAYLSLRTWTGKPYRSKQSEFLRLHDIEVGIQRISIDTFGFITVEGNASFIDKFMANNDGLKENDFDYWFGNKLPFEGAIIHFTNFRY